MTVLFDTETTGAEAIDRIVQVGAMVFDESNLSTIETFDELCKAPVPIKVEAMEVHHITPEMIEDKNSYLETDFCNRLAQLNTNDNYLVAHNISFDLEMIKKEAFDCRMQLIDTLRISRHLYPEMASHRLQRLRYELGLYKLEKAICEKYNLNIQAHDAIGDVVVMYLLFNRMADDVKSMFPGENVFDKFIELTNTPVTVLTFKFGKYKDRKISEIYRENPGYIQWMKNNLDLDEDMLHTFAKIEEKMIN